VTDNGFVDFDPGKISVGDMEDIEDVAGVPFQDCFDEDGNPINAKVIKAVIWILRRKGDPSFTLEQARNVEMQWFRKVRWVGEEPNPTDAATSESSQSSATSGE